MWFIDEIDCVAYIPQVKVRKSWEGPAKNWYFVTSNHSLDSLFLRRFLNIYFRMVSQPSRYLSELPKFLDISPGHIIFFIPERKLW